MPDSTKLIVNDDQLLAMDQSHDGERQSVSQRAYDLFFATEFRSAMTTFAIVLVSMW